MIKYFGHACFSVEFGGKTLLFDPFISGNPLITVANVNSINADYILISHGHADHILDCIAIAKQTGAKVICSWEIHEWLNKQEITNTHPMNVGGKWNFDFGTVKCVVAQHSSGLPDGSYGGNPMGFLFMDKNKEGFYYAGDTALTLDMQLIPTWCKVQFAFLPLGDNFTMDATDAVQAAKFVQCNKIIAMHFDTFGFIKIDHSDVKNTFTTAGLSIKIPQIDEHFSI